MKIPSSSFKRTILFRSDNISGDALYVPSSSFKRTHSPTLKMGIFCCFEDIDFTQEVELSHFSLYRAVGKGSFGKVCMVEHKGSKLMFALKYINKVKCIKMRAVNNIIQERRILEEVSHAFVCNLRYAFQDDENIFMVLDLMLGGDMRFHLLEMGTFTSQQIIFYAAEIGLALEYLHDKNIVHRDIKPDNLLLSSDGHASLTDFNVAAKIRKGTQLTAFAGSLAYVAPEIFSKRYGTAVDYWSLGVTFYELLYGKRPFRGKNHDALVNAIKTVPVEFPEKPNSQNCLDFISQLLQRDVAHRFSNGTKYKEHGIFRGMDWQAIESRQVKPPFTPNSRKVNFDSAHELEELLLPDNPLTTQKKTKGKRFSNTGEDLPPEYEIMEKKFKVFDFTKKYGPQQPGERRKAQLTARPLMSYSITAINEECESIGDVMEEKGEDDMKKAFDGDASLDGMQDTEGS